ncbi:hypothetical protein V5799_005414 [Amblyomma americanum]|uniref:Uncharacterized protein n=1 Tax=Amblyomma americanum TaxID=6943 RepID=A0AAQ4DZB5_AMBAM
MSIKQTSWSPSFCCPSAGRQLVAIVNDTVRPCDNLYAYVCAGVVRNGTGKSEMLLRNLEEMILGLPAAPAGRFASSASSLTSSKAGMFLQGLYSSCLAASNAKPHRDQDGHDVPSRFFQMAAALWAITSKLLAQLNEPNLLAFLFMINLRYQIRSVVEIQYLSSTATLLFYHDALELNTEMHLECVECVAAALMAYNRNGETSRQVSDGSSQRELNSSRLTFDDVGGFAERLHSLYSKRRAVERFVMTNISQLWPAEQFVKALSILSWVDSPADVSVESFAPHQLVILRREITDSNNWAVGAVYLVAHTVARSYLTIPSVRGTDYAHPACMELTTDMTALVNTAHWDLYGSPEKEKIVADMYRSVVDAVAFEASSGLLVSEAGREAHRPIRSLISSITLLTAEASSVDAAEVPKATTVDFTGNLLLGRSFQFEARKKRHRLGLPGSASKLVPVLHTGRRLYLEVPASFYR